MNAQAQEVEAGAEQSSAKPKSKAETVTVVMQDGEKREFSVNKKTGAIQFMKKDTVLHEDGTFKHVRLDFNNGEFRIITPPVALHGKFIGHGVEQKYGDELAGLKAEDGSPPDIDDVVLTIDDMNENIMKGEWSMRKEGSGMGGTSVLIKALMAYGGKTLETVKAFLKDKDQKFKTALRHNDKRPNASGETVASIVKRLEAEKAAKAANIDTSGSLDDLDKMGDAEPVAVEG